MFYAITPGTIHAFHEAKDRDNFIDRFNRNPMLPPCDAAKILSYEKRSRIKTKTNRYVAYDNFSGHYSHQIDDVATATRMRQNLAELRTLLIPRSFP